MKTQKINEIKFRSQYLYLVEDLLENITLLKKDYNSVCFLDCGFFSKKIVKSLSCSLNINVDVLDFKNLKNIKNGYYDIIFAPLSLQYLISLEGGINYLNAGLNSNGVLFASGYNVLKAKENAILFKNILDSKKLIPSKVEPLILLDYFSAKDFKDKALSKEEINILDNTVELVTLFCTKKDKEIVKIVIE